MIQHLTLFLAPESGAMQATPNSPPAVKAPASRFCRVKKGAWFMAGVAGNAAGFGMLLAGCWFSLQLMQVLMV